MSRSPLDLDDLVEHWTLLPDELDLIVRRHEATRLVFAAWLKFYTRHGRFPRGRSELHDHAVAFMARQLKVSAGDIGLVEWDGRTAERHRAAIRGYLGFRECSTADADKLTAWLAAEVAGQERRFDLVRQELLAEFRRGRIEPPADGRIERMVRSALHQAEKELCARVHGRLPADVLARLEELAGADDDGPSLLATIKAVPGSVSLDSMLAEIEKLRAVRAVGVPAAALANVAPKVLAGWRARAMVEAPSHLARHTPQLRVTLLAALLRLREREITDALVELLIATVHRIDARAQRKNVAEGWNGGNQVLFYGKGGDIATNRHDEQELSVACLHVLQAAVAYVNTLLVQDILAEPAWPHTLTPEDWRGLTPLFWTHVAPYGEAKLNMAKRLELRTELAAAPAPVGPAAPAGFGQL
ncbi:DUF4158 domain-containing protein [Micromonospora sp. NPDC023814]|uniref:DUF4158 domain-containing protein n=1 Tax=Micromonospora sp. NPDC023814 TaxID=3154596 RepID=UPI0033E5D8C8